MILDDVDAAQVTFAELLHDRKSIDDEEFLGRWDRTNTSSTCARSRAISAYLESFDGILDD